MLFFDNKNFLALAICCFYSLSWAAAPDDIPGNMRAWYDAYDINGNNNFTDNPASGANIASWADKSGLGNHVSHPSVVRQPTLKTLATNYGVKFTNDRLYRTGDIWAGSVTDIDIFAAVSTDVRTSHWLVSSNRSTSDSVRRVGTHIPWGNNITYWDRGTCCGSSRLNGSVPISIGTETKYAWNFYASHSTANDPFGLNRRMYVMQNGNNRLSNNKTDTYTPLANAIFALGAMARADSQFFNGTIGEAIIYQRTVNTAERNILNSYLFARWQIPGTLNRDQYAGDTAAGYYYHVGSVGQVSTGAVTTGTSLGLTINTISDSNDQYLLAGLQNLTPPSGTVSTDIAMPLSERAARDWYLDRSPNGAAGTSQLSFDLNELGITAVTGEEFALIYRSNTGVDYTSLQTSSVTGTTVSFTVSAPADGFYTIAKLTMPAFNVQKTIVTETDPVNLSSNPKSIPSAEHLYAIRISNSASGSADTDSVVINDPLNNSLEFFTGDLDGNGSPIIFEDGTPSCNLSFNFIDFASTTDDIEFFDAGDIAIYVINPDADGYDPDIRSIQIKPKNIFAGKTGTDDPNCTFKYRTRLR